MGMSACEVYTHGSIGGMRSSASAMSDAFTLEAVMCLLNSIWLVLGFLAIASTYADCSCDDKCPQMRSFDC